MSDMPMLWNIRINVSYKRMLRHREKMQRKWHKSFMECKSFWLQPGSGPLFEPQYKDPRYLWVRSQMMVMAMVDFKNKHPEEYEKNRQIGEELKAKGFA